MKLSHRIILLAVIAANHSLLAQTSVLEANRDLASSGSPAPAPGAQESPYIEIEAIASIDVGASDLVTVSCLKGSCELVGLEHDQTVNIDVQFSAAREGEMVTLEALDGGGVSADAVNVDANGAIHFRFSSGHPPGVYRIALRRGAQETGLQFWVRDDQNAGNNPLVVNPGK